MNVGFLCENELKAEFVFSPIFEMLASMHVISVPEHHLDRRKWMEELSDKIPDELLHNIKKYGRITGDWLIPMDFSNLSPYRDLCVPDALAEIEKLSLQQWNEVYKLYDKSIGWKEKNNIIEIMKNYYEAFFYNEINFLQPFLIHTIKRKINMFMEEGLLESMGKIHERLEINENKIIFHKNKDYSFDLNKLNKVVITASTFISPHLLMHGDKGILYLTMLVSLEEKNEAVPDDLVDLLKALGDGTRLRILREMKTGAESTQGLALSLNLTEAGISKHLKVLCKARLIEKKRQGNFMMYSINKDAIDYIPYKLYEFIMR
ncbi:winged helix-turn-helix transcriptional regulator [Sedimentibacter hydroxybenzoicus DSM 7310]|uniref:Winged helix-turn-helix transcriptional regulator n=1 Tax=Sedimentibacter hydroxybenzoicus DSM 7310 TaxID=1123245 RepID=A0A974BM66_SEDHY|nr:metalloregulator ArsR/SmtB family transcription factor [Sedimentibacter hydroxybenzoicus]NYB75959.1 winged helix-turn-helix transcriptional regulator [Sedimentibacter hydroxybenzoicus DSM 7310]